LEGIIADTMIAKQARSEPAAAAQEVEKTNEERETSGCRCAINHTPVILKAEPKQVAAPNFAGLIGDVFAERVPQVNRSRGSEWRRVQFCLGEDHLECGLQSKLARREVWNYGGAVQSRKRPFTEYEGGAPNVMAANLALGSECDTEVLWKRVVSAPWTLVVLMVAPAVAVDDHLCKFLNIMVVGSVHADGDPSPAAQAFLTDHFMLSLAGGQDGEAPSRAFVSLYGAKVTGAIFSHAYDHASRPVQFGSLLVSLCTERQSLPKINVGIIDVRDPLLQDESPEWGVVAAWFNDAEVGFLTGCFGVGNSSAVAVLARRTNAMLESPLYQLVEMADGELAGQDVVHRNCWLLYCNCEDICNIVSCFLTRNE
jgi:hypothetical protein